MASRFGRNKKRRMIRERDHALAAAKSATREADEAISGMQYIAAKLGVSGDCIWRPASIRYRKLAGGCQLPRIAPYFTGEFVSSIVSSVGFKAAVEKRRDGVCLHMIAIDTGTESLAYFISAEEFRRRGIMEEDIDSFVDCAYRELGQLIKEHLMKVGKLL